MIKVLLVEDEPTNLHLILEILNSKGFHVHSVMNGIDAIEKAKKELYDIILMDISLPDIDGIEAARSIKKESVNKDIPIIAVTAYAMIGDKERILEAGLDDYISKPIIVNEFLRKIEKYIWQAKTREQDVKS